MERPRTKKVLSRDVEVMKQGDSMEGAEMGRDGKE
jgi:hypothetical protein